MTQTRLPTLEDFADAEHCVLEDVTVQQPALVLSESRADAKAIDNVISIADKLRGRSTTVTLYAEGWADIESTFRKRSSFCRIDLHFLDAEPESSQHRPIKLLKILAGLAGATAVCAIPAWFGWLAPWSTSVMLIMLTATLITAGTVFYRSQERIVFKTLHGRAEAVRFVAGLGTIGRFRRLVPQLSEAIAAAAATIGEDTAVYLRAEMREHYRLKEDGVLSEGECADSTSRVLNRFNDPV